MKCESNWDVPRWDEFKQTLPVEFRDNKKVLEQVKSSFHREVETMMNFVTDLRKSGKSYHAYFGSFYERPENAQIVAHFSVKDLTKPDNPNQVNWHLQNTSQWVYAGALVVDKDAVERGDERVVSLHH